MHSNFCFILTHFYYKNFCCCSVKALIIICSIGHGGGWGYSGHSIEAIRFMADTDILLGGFGLFGGRGEYTAKLKVSFI